MVYIDKTSGVTRLTGASGQAAPASNPLDSWPIGSVFIAYGTTSPATLLGGGTWVQFGQGQVLMGRNASDPDFDTIGETGGSKEKTLILDNLPEHVHWAGTLGVSSVDDHSHTISRSNGVGNHNTRVAQGNSNSVSNPDTNPAGGHSHSITGQTGNVDGPNDQPFDILPPYVVVQFWRRTA